ncbi:MAG: hypothetical protein QXQ57_07355 [Sulfolobales archaeon]
MWRLGVREDNSYDLMLEELRHKLKDLTPGMDILVETAQKIPGAEGGLSKRDLNTVTQDLERVWHVLRLHRLLADFFGDEIGFGGDSILNYYYMVGVGEPPRFTFDLDASWHRRERLKRVVLARMAEFNRWLAENNLILRIPVGGGRVAELFRVEHDVEKEHFPDILPLRMPVITRYGGEPFHRFLGIADYSLISELRMVFSETLGIKDPRIDYVRFEVGLNPEDMPWEDITLENLFGWRVRSRVTRLEYQLASKIRFKVAKDFGDKLGHAIHDILKAVLDLRLLSHVDARAVSEYASPFDLGIAESNISTLLASGQRFWTSHHYTLIRRRYTLEEVIAKVREHIRKLARS